MSSRKPVSNAMNFRKPVPVAVFFKTICRWRDEFQKTSDCRGVFLKKLPLARWILQNLWLWWCFCRKPVAVAII
jgi:hypothetical protein